MNSSNTVGLFCIRFCPGRSTSPSFSTGQAASTPRNSRWSRDSLRTPSPRLPLETCSEMEEKHPTCSTHLNWSHPERSPPPKNLWYFPLPTSNRGEARTRPSGSTKAANCWAIILPAHRSWSLSPTAGAVTNAPPKKQQTQPGLRA